MFRPVCGRIAERLGAVAEKLPTKFDSDRARALRSAIRFVAMTIRCDDPECP